MPPAFLELSYTFSQDSLRLLFLGLYIRPPSFPLNRFRLPWLELILLKTNGSLPLSYESLLLSFLFAFIIPDFANNILLRFFIFTECERLELSFFSLFLDS